MTQSTESFLSKVWRYARNFGNELIAGPQAAAKVVSWFSSKYIELPDTPEGRLTRQAIKPKSWFDKGAAIWAECSLWTKLSVLVGISLVSGLIGLALSAPIFLAITSFFVCIGVHSALVSHHLKRIEHAQQLMSETLTLQQDAQDVIELINQEVVDTLCAQKKTMNAQLTQLSGDADALHEATDSLSKQVELVTQVNAGLKDAELSIHTTLDEVHKTTTQLDASLQTIQESCGTFSDSVGEFSALVESIETSHKELDATVSTLSSAVAQLTNTTNTDSLLSEFALDEGLFATELSHYQAQAHQQELRLTAFDERQRLRKEKATVDQTTLLDDAVVADYKSILSVTSEVIAQLDERQRQRAQERVLNEARIKAFLSLTAKQECELASTTNAPIQLVDTQSTFLPQIIESMQARQAQIDLLHLSHASNTVEMSEKERLVEHSRLIDATETGIKARSEQRRKAQAALLQAQCRFFTIPASPEEGAINLAPGIQAG